MNIRYLIITLLLSILTGAAGAQGIESDPLPVDFKATNDQGITLSSHITSKDTPRAVAVTSEADGLYTGDVAIPPKVKDPDGGQEYAVTAIGKWAFYNCKALTSVRLPDGLTEIGQCAFTLSDALASIHLPDGLISILGDAFYGCDKLTSIDLPDGLTSIGKQAFIYCNGLTSIDIPGSVTAIGQRAFLECDALASVNIGEGVTRIGSYAFCYCPKLAKVKLPSTLKVIEEGAFMNDSVLADIDLPGKLDSIGNVAFVECHSLPPIHIPASVTYIHEGAFYNCKALTEYSVDEANTAYSSADGVLYDKDKTTLLAFPITQTSVEIPATVTRLADYAFAHSKLTSLTLPAGLTEIGMGALENCAHLESLRVAEGSKSFAVADGTLYDKDMRTIIFFHPKRTSVSIPATVRRIGTYAFAHTSLTEIDIPDGVETIEHDAFQMAHQLSFVSIGKGIREIGDAAFLEAPLETLVIRADKAPTQEGNLLGLTSPEAPHTLYVPYTALRSYFSDDNWSWLLYVYDFSIEGYEPGYNDPVTGIQLPATTTGSRVYATDGALHVEATRPLTVTVTTFAGVTLISERPLPAGHSRLTGLPTGPVIVSLSDGTSVKISNHR